MKTATAFLVIILICACGQEKKSSPLEYKIAYNVLFDADSDNYEVFSMDLDGGNVENLTQLSGVEWTYYADGDKVYYISDKDTTNRYFTLYHMKSDGSNKTRFSDIRLADSWHSSRYDGKELIVRPHSSVDTAFYILNSNGDLIKKLTPPFPYFSDPLFSPDGNKIVFRAAKAPFKRNEMFRDELYIMNDDGSELKQLTYYPEKDTTAKWHNYKAGPPRWNTAENFISYQSVQNGKYSLFAITPDGEKQWKLTDLEYGEGWHDWSPDGSMLAVEIFDKEQTQFHIGLMDWESKDFKILTDTLYQYQQAPVFISSLPD